VHLETAARGGDALAVYELKHRPTIPPGAAHVWKAWVEIAATRGSSGFGLSPLSRLEVHAWETDEGVGLDAWERRAIFKLDGVYRAAMAQSDEEE
jgi:hypothetical protein